MSGCTAGFSSRVAQQEKACSGPASSFTPRNSSWPPDTWGHPGSSHSPVLVWLFSTQSAQNLHTDSKHSQLLRVFQKCHVSCLRSFCADSSDRVTLDPHEPSPGWGLPLRTHSQAPLPRARSLSLPVGGSGTAPASEAAVFRASVC